MGFEGNRLVADLYNREVAVAVDVAHSPLALAPTVAFLRFLDIIIVLPTTILCIPLFALIALAIALDSEGPILYRQVRVGKGGELFTLLKFRSMFQNAERNGAQWAESNDPRVTRVGFFLRKHRLDELPQLVNVLRGEMTLVGPRPERPEFVLRFYEVIPSFLRRLQVKPGLTGWAQVNGGYDLCPQKKLVYDLYYIENWSLGLFLRTLFLTVRVIISGSGAR